MILVFDTETAHSPDSYSAPATDTDNWPPIVQIAWVVFSIEGTELHRRCALICPDDFAIAPDATRIHGITTERALRHGENVAGVLDELERDLRIFEPLLVAHNYAFDRNVVGAAFHRAGRPDPLEGKASLCTMQDCETHFSLPDGKWPKLGELFEGLFGRPMEGAHDALQDVLATARCLFALRERGLELPERTVAPTHTSTPGGLAGDDGRLIPLPPWLPALQPLWPDEQPPPLEVLFSAYEYRTVYDYRGPYPPLLHVSASIFGARPLELGCNQWLGEAVGSPLGMNTGPTECVQRLQHVAVKHNTAGFHGSAIACLLSAYELDGENPRTLFLLGYCHFDAGEHDEAVRWYRALLKRGDNAAAANNLSIALAKLGDAAGSAEMARHAALLADTAPYHRRAGQAYMELLRFMGTIEAKVDDEKAKPKGRRYRELRAYAVHACFHFEQALRTEPAGADRRGMAQALYKLGRVEDATQILNTLRTEEPDNYLHSSVLGDVLYGEGRFDDASEAYSAALAAKSDHAYAAFARARCRGRLERWDEAIQDYEHAATLAPESSLYTSSVEQARKDYESHRAKLRARELERRRRLERDRPELVNQIARSTSLPATSQPSRKPVFWRTTHVVAIALLLLFLFNGMVQTGEDLQMVFLVSYSMGAIAGFFRWAG